MPPFPVHTVAGEMYQCRPRDSTITTQHRNFSPLFPRAGGSVVEPLTGRTRSFANRQNTTIRVVAAAPLKVVFFVRRTNIETIYIYYISFTLMLLMKHTASLGGGGASEREHVGARIARV